MLTADEFEQIAADERRERGGRFIIPVYKRLSADLLTPVSAFLALRGTSRYPILLESVEGGEKLARYSFILKDPYRLVTAREGRVEIDTVASHQGIAGTTVDTAVDQTEGATAGASVKPTGGTTFGRSVNATAGTTSGRLVDATADTSAGTSRNPTAGALGGTSINATAGTNGQTAKGNVLQVLQTLIDAYRQVNLPDLPRLTGGAVGYFSYDTVRLLEHLPNTPPDDLGLPDAIWGFYDTVVAFDHVKHQLILIKSAFVDDETDLPAAYARAASGIEALEQELKMHIFDPPEPVVLTQPEMSSNFTREEFESAVERAKRYIYEGDIFQVVLSQRFSSTFRGDRFNLYRALRQVNPSPYLFYLDFEDFALIGSSPEVLVRAEDRRAEVLPIAGTRPRGRTAEEDRAFEAELLADPKERAEHLMLVDLGRNDLGRVCNYTSVSVGRYAYVERYSHVMHIVSSVSGEMLPERGATDVLAACFPAGTVSGAPKVRAMEIIDELEPTKRNVYAGAVGYIDHSGNLDTCIAIRTMVVRGDTVHVQAGAGIVADSDPYMEYLETVNKARALRQAIRVASEDLL